MPDTDHGTPEAAGWPGTITTLEEAAAIAADPDRNRLGLSAATILDLDGPDYDPGFAAVDPSADERIRTGAVVNPHTGSPRELERNR